MDAATHPVFGVPDIFVDILELLEPRELLRIQRTCKHFNTMINESPALQRKLCRHSTRVVTEDLPKVELSHNEDEKCLKRPIELCSREGHLTKVKLNPFMSRLARLGKPYEALCSSGDIVCFNDKGQYDILGDIDYSWRSMQLSYPACTEVSYYISWQLYETGEQWTVTSGRTTVRQKQNETGVTLGELLDDALGSQSLGEVIEYESLAEGENLYDHTDKYDAQQGVRAVLKEIAGQNRIGFDNGIVIQLINCIGDEPWPTEMWYKTSSDAWPGNPFMYDGEEHNWYEDHHMSDISWDLGSDSDEDDDPIASSPVAQTQLGLSNYEGWP